jgi:hypothetical protein
MFNSVLLHVLLTVNAVRGTQLLITLLCKYQILSEG